MTIYTPAFYFILFWTSVQGCVDWELQKLKHTPEHHQVRVRHCIFLDTTLKGSTFRLFKKKLFKHRKKTPQGIKPSLQNSIYLSHPYPIPLGHMVHFSSHLDFNIMCGLPMSTSVSLNIKYLAGTPTCHDTRQVLPENLNFLKRFIYALRCCTACFFLLCTTVLLNSNSTENQSLDYHECQNVKRDDRLYKCLCTEKGKCSYK